MVHPSSPFVPITNPSAQLAVYVPDQNSRSVAGHSCGWISEEHAEPLPALNLGFLSIPKPELHHFTI